MIPAHRDKQELSTVDWADVPVGLDNKYNRKGTIKFFLLGFFEKVGVFLQGAGWTRDVIPHSTTH